MKLSVLRLESDEAGPMPNRYRRPDAVDHAYSDRRLVPLGASPVISRRRLKAVKLACAFPCTGRNVVVGLPFHPFRRRSGAGRPTVVRDITPLAAAVPMRARRSPAGRQGEQQGQVARLGLSSFDSQKKCVDTVAQAMDDEQVGFLDARGAVGRHAEVDVVVAASRRSGPALAGQRHDAHVVIVRRLDGFDDVTGIARGRDGERHVAGMARTAPGGENLAERIIVADGGQDRGIGGQRNRRQFYFTFGLETADQFGSKMLRVAGRAADCRRPESARR